MKKLYQPIQASERIHALDIIRGFALVGILIVNMAFFSTPILYADVLGINLFEGGWDQTAQSLIIILFEGNFYTLFSILFGIGFMIFIERAEQRGVAFRSLYLRRVLVLLGFGLIHLIFIWYGDILTVYAIVGLFLLLFYRRSVTTLIIWIILLSTAPILLLLLLGLLTFAFGDELFKDSFFIEMKEYYEYSMYVFAEGSYSEIIAQRLLDISLMMESTVILMPSILALFLIGVLIWKKRILQDLPNSLPLIRKLCIITLAAGLVFSLLAFYIHSLIDSGTSAFQYLYYAIGLISGPAIALFYFTSILILLQKEFWRKILYLFQPLGRMALTNYIMQSIICTFIFYSYGLGLYGKVGPALTTLLAIIIIIIQIIISRLWFNKFTYGPLEWLWRVAIYGKRLVRTPS